MRTSLAVFIFVALLATPACRRRGGDSRGHIPMPAGGVAAPIDGGDALVEDACSYPVRTWRMPLATHEITIEDVGMTTALGAVLERTGATLVVNGGFFDEGKKALGLTMSNGIQLSPVAKKLSGGVLTIDAVDRGRLFETESFVLPEGTRFAVQCRPRLVVQGQPNVKSDDGKRSERTALCLRDEGRTIEVVLVRGDEGGPSLYALGRWLAARGCEDALNLDGGPSAGAAWRDDESGATEVLVPRGPIRHAIVFRPRDRRPSAPESR